MDRIEVLWVDDEIEMLKPHFLFLEERGYNVTACSNGQDALDLIDDIHLISIYKKHHQEVWPEITKSLLDSGIENAEIYCVGNRLFMILEVEKLKF